MRRCPFKGCVEDLPDHLFACRSHWFSLSQADRRKINAAYQSYLKDEVDLAELRRVQQEVLGTRGTA